jgi:hypothetical protein
MRVKIILLVVMVTMAELYHSTTQPHHIIESCCRFFASRELLPMLLPLAGAPGDVVSWNASRSLEWVTMRWLAYCVPREEIARSGSPSEIALFSFSGSARRRISDPRTGKAKAKGSKEMFEKPPLSFSIAI